MQGNDSSLRQGFCGLSKAFVVLSTLALAMLVGCGNGISDPVLAFKSAKTLGKHIVTTPAFNVKDDWGFWLEGPFSSVTLVDLGSGARTEYSQLSGTITVKNGGRYCLELEGNTYFRVAVFQDVPRTGRGISGIPDHLWIEAPGPKFDSSETLDTKHHVHSVKIAKATRTRHRQIIHILDSHFIDHNSFVAELKADEAGAQLTTEDTQQRWSSFLNDLESLQIEQMAVLRELAESEGLRQVFVEGLTGKDIDRFERLSLAVSKGASRTGDSNAGQHLSGADLENTLRVGAAGRLLGSKVLEKVLPTEDEKSMQLRNLGKDNHIKFDAAAVKYRDESIVRNVLISDSRICILVGGEHDLAESIERIGGGIVEYVRVEVKAYRKALGESKAK